MDFTSRIIQGKNIRLETLSSHHIEALCECLLGETDGWFSRHYGMNTPEKLQGALENRIHSNQNRTSLSFVTIDLKTSKVAGISHFMKIDELNRQMEIGGTQVGKKFRRTYVNTETKYLLLREAFEVLKAIRVYFKVDIENSTSQKAILRIGAQHEGTLRSEWILPDGRIRDCHIYSIIESEWTSIKDRLASSF